MFDILIVFLDVLRVPLKAGKGNNLLKYAPNFSKRIEQFSERPICSGDSVSPNKLLLCEDQILLKVGPVKRLHYA